MELRKKTKIISTIGPKSCEEPIIKQLIENGVNIFRFNMKHGTIKWHEHAIQKVQKVADELNQSIGILIDLQGPEIRLQTRDEQDIELQEGKELKIGVSFDDLTVQARVPHQSFFDALNVGDRFTVDDGFIRFVVTQKHQDSISAGILDTTTLSTNKGLNLVGIDIDLPSLIEDDCEKLHLATIKRVDFVALSFVRTRQDILTLKEEMKSIGVEANIVAKIESQKGLDNIDEIIDESDAIMIARGDLGIEVPIEQITYHQKQIIKKCRIAHKPVVVATQMLQSMIENPIPTRAEATDVANAVFDGTDAVMLSGETATGKYPVQTVKAMFNILAFNEEKAEVMHFDSIPKNATELIVSAAKNIATHESNLKIDFIVVLTETGYTARIVSSFRPKVSIIALTYREKIVETLTMTYGVIGFKAKFSTKTKELSVEAVISKLKENNLVKVGQTIMMIHGQHWRRPDQTNAIVIRQIG